MKRVFLTALVVALGAQVSPAAPLFPDVREGHWARDAVAALAAKGLVEGYPDGTFKGDRVASRWEVAMIVARLLARMEQEHATFASKADLEAVRKLAATLKEELEALGVRVTVLEEGTHRLDQRVTELERIKFYGSLHSRLVVQDFYNQGQPDNDSGRRGAGAAGIPYLDYNAAIGTTNASVIRPQTHGVIPVVDYRLGRALTNGVGFTSKATLGMNIVVSPDVDAGVEFAAYTSQGNSIVDGYWGVSAPQLLNPNMNSAVPGGNLTGATNTPWTRMVLDNLWVVHKPSKTKLVVGAIDKVGTDRFVYLGIPNMSAYGPVRLPGIGFDVTGQVDFSAEDRFRWEVLGTIIGDADVYAGMDYGHTVLGGDLAYEFRQGKVKFNYLRYYDDLPNNPNLSGLFSVTNTPFLNATTWSPLQWVNPPGYFAAQRSDFERANTGAVAGALVPNTFDTRPIPGWNGAADNSLGMTAGAGDYGPQALSVYGLSAGYDVVLGESAAPEKEKDKKDKKPTPPPDKIRLMAEYGHSDYKSNRNSPYHKGGDLMSLEVAPLLLGSDLDLSLKWLSVDPTFSPVLLQANLAGFRFPQTCNFAGRFFLFDSNAYPHNREGLRFTGKYQFDEKAAVLTWKLGLLQQKQTSLYDVRVPASSISPGTPTNLVLGFSPGFFDMIFYGLAHPSLYGPRSSSSFTDQLQPMENPRGKALEAGLGFSYQFKDPNLKVALSYDHYGWDRPTSLTAQMGGSQNRVRLGSDTIDLGLTWKPDDTWTVRTGCTWIRVGGHYDPAGLSNAYAVQQSSTDFTNLDSTQTIPFVGFDNQLTKNITWSADFRYYSTHDSVGSEVFLGAGSGARGYTTHPFSWAGPQISTEFKLTF